jgi:calcineurin-like phosphoesterase family protein
VLDNKTAYTLDVGVDGHAYTPISFDEIVHHMSTKTVTLKNPRIKEST